MINFDTIDTQLVIIYAGHEWEGISGHRVTPMASKEVHQHVTNGLVETQTLLLLKSSTQNQRPVRKKEKVTDDVFAEEFVS